MTVHIVKCENPYFTDIWNNDKDFEHRFNDRNYKLYDYVIQREFINKQYTGREILTIIRYIKNHNEIVGLKDGWIVFGFVILHTTSEFSNHYGR